jgi:ribulose-bisphosphate carboxylase large chain
MAGGATLPTGRLLGDQTMPTLRDGMAPAEFRSACDLPAAPSAATPALLLRAAADYTWEQRPRTTYKADETLPFRGVSRCELLGKTGEAGAFDLRYFELAPGGHTSLEKHAHTHALIALRGRGVLLVSDRRLELTPHDVAYIPPLAVHQVRNAGPEPFGFFCIVDRERDKPQAP